jgi:hypothetical protein
MSAQECASLATSKEITRKFCPYPRGRQVPNSKWNSHQAPRRKAGFRFRRAAEEYPITSCPREGDSRAPRCRLADLGRSLQDQARGHPDTDPMKYFTRASSASPRGPRKPAFHATPPPASAPIAWASGQRGQRPTTAASSASDTCATFRTRSAPSYSTCVDADVGHRTDNHARRLA